MKYSKTILAFAALMIFAAAAWTLQDGIVSEEVLRQQSMLESVPESAQLSS